MYMNDNRMKPKDHYDIVKYKIFIFRYHIKIETQ